MARERKRPLLKKSDTFTGAVARFQTARTAVYRAAKAKKENWKDWATFHQVRNEEFNASSIVLQSFARDILPTVLKGEWRLSRGGHHIGPLKYVSGDLDLLDHVCAFRCLDCTQGYRRYAYLAEPYEKPSQPQVPTLQRFHKYSGMKPVDLAVVPLGKEVSSWNPGSTTAFIVADLDVLLTPLVECATDLGPYPS